MIWVINSLAYLRVKGGENGVGQGRILSPWLFHMYMDAVMKEMKMGIGRMGESGDYLTFCMQMT